MGSIDPKGIIYKRQRNAIICASNELYAYGRYITPTKKTSSVQRSIIFFFMLYCNNFINNRAITMKKH